MSKEKRYEMTHNVSESQIYGLPAGYKHIELVKKQRYVVFTGQDGTVRYVPFNTPPGNYGNEREIDGFQKDRIGQQQTVRSYAYGLHGDYQTSLSDKITCLKFTYNKRSGGIYHVYIPRNLVKRGDNGTISIRRGGRKTRKRNDTKEGGGKTLKRSPR